MRWALPAMLLLLALGGCQTIPLMPDAKLSSGYALLYDLLDQEANVDKLLIVRDASEPTKTLIKNIAEAARSARDQIKQFADADAHLSLGDPGLPSVESQTRAAIKSEMTKELLTGDHFELNLLVAQVKATQYAAYLARVLSKADGDAKRSAFFADTEKKFNDLNLAAMARLAPR
ncbi:MAG: hypothetical protein GC162_18455 [Planctomycetes bacterium]|nr:hypothetical protein [Planctomycetota bacterium]